MEISIRVEGVSPLLLNRFTDEAALAASAETRVHAPAGDRGTPREQAEQKLYLGVDGKTLIFPSTNMLRSFYDGGLYHKAGAKKITTARESMLCSCLFIVEAELPIQSREGWRVDTRPVVNPTTRGRILGPKIIRDVIDDAGTRVGVGDFRPSRKGPYGRFKLTHWEVKSQVLQVA